MEEKKRPISELMGVTMEKIREMVDVNTIIGQPIQTDGMTLIPVSKLSFGFGTGGGESAPSENKPGKENFFGGGSGAGVNISPVAFLIVKDDSVKLLPVNPPAGNTIDRVVEMVPELVDKVTVYLDKKQDKEEF